MRQCRSVDEFEDLWSLSIDDHRSAVDKRGAARLGFEVLSKVLRPIVARGRADLADLGGVVVGLEDFAAELCRTADGACWSAFGPTVGNRRVDTDLLITGQAARVSVPAAGMVRVAGVRPGVTTPGSIFR